MTSLLHDCTQLGITSYRSVQYFSKKKNALEKTKKIAAQYDSAHSLQHDHDLAQGLHGVRVGVGVLHAFSYNKMSTAFL